MHLKTYTIRKETTPCIQASTVVFNSETRKLKRGRSIATGNSTTQSKMVQSETIQSGTTPGRQRCDIVYGNKPAWVHAENWIKHRVLDVGPRILILKGPSGVGKTMGAHLLAKNHGRHIVEINVCDVVGDFLEQSIVEGCTRAAIRKDGNVCQDSASLVLIDDLEAFTNELLNVIACKIASLPRMTGVICTCSESFQIPPCLKNSDASTVVHLKALSIQDLCRIARSEPSMALFSAPSLMNFVVDAQGDARRLQNLVAMMNVGEKMDTYEKKLPQSVFDGARQLLFGSQMTISQVGQTMHLFDARLMSKLLFENYVTALTGYSLPDIDSVGRAAEVFAECDVLRRSSVLLPEAMILQGSVVRFSGKKTCNFNQRLSCPSHMGTSSNASKGLLASYLQDCGRVSR